MRRVLVVVPTRGPVDYRTCMALQAERDTYPEIPPIEFVAGGLAVSDVRHQAINLFLASDAEVLIMVDNDIGPPPGFISTLASCIDDETHVIGLPTLIVQAQVQIPFPTVYQWLDAEGASDPSVAAGVANPEPFQGGYMPIDQPFGREGLVECDGVGSAVIAISREVLEDERLRHPFALVPDHTGVTLFSDDLAFCRRARVAGYRVWADYDMWIAHFTTVDLTQVGAMYAAAMMKEQERPRLWVPPMPGAAF